MINRKVIIQRKKEKIKITINYDNYSSRNIRVKKYPLSKELIEEISNKWQKRTKELMTKWPKEGTFDVSLC